MSRRPLVGVSLKLYFGQAATLDYVGRVARAGLPTADLDLVVIPPFTALAPAADLLSGSGVLLGAQDVFWADSGAYTGEIGPATLAELGVSLVEIGHYERRTLFGETDEVVARKVSAALGAGLTPLLCVGEGASDRGRAAGECVRQLDAALTGAPAGDLVVAYEPHWAIGAAEPAEPAHIVEVCRALRVRLDELGYGSGRILYGGTAGLGTHARIRDAVDGLFLGRRAHEVAALVAIVEEVRAGQAEVRTTRR